MSAEEWETYLNSTVGGMEDIAASGDIASASQVGEGRGGKGRGGEGRGG